MPTLQWLNREGALGRGGCRALPAFGGGGGSVGGGGGCGQYAGGGDNLLA